MFYLGTEKYQTKIQYIFFFIKFENSLFYLFLDLLILTVASEKTDGFKRFIDSANLNGLKTKVNILLVYYIFMVLINICIYVLYIFLLRFLAWISHGKEAT